MTNKKEEKTRDRILKSAIDEFVEYGFYGARMQRIAQRAKVNKALIHYYYRNKEAVYGNVIETVKDMLINKLSDIEDDNAPVEKKMEEIMDVYIEIFDKHHTYARLMLYEVIRGGKEIKKHIIASIHKIPFNPVSGKLYKYFKRKMKQGEIKKVNVFHLVISIVSQVVPVYFARPIFRGFGGAMGIDKALFEKMVRERKKFVLSLIMDGIRTKGRAKK